MFSDFLLIFYLLVTLLEPSFTLLYFFLFHCTF
ncbi:unnamed protein product [Spirodela intermedia]|uniref:Uncharacterized protein n=1 Tax=Spirodela intermedia TaxID=51605 RepID=A0ABN7EAY1_SPIIN|nr:unnamed protein product [Spirodela intermedia]